MLLGKIIAETALRENKFITWLPSYGAEVRGGTAYCMVIISDQEIGSPYVKNADTLIVMNNPSLLRFANRVKRGGLLLVNSSLADRADLKSAVSKKNNICIYSRPFTDVALELGNIKVANTVALGFYLAKKKWLKKETVLKAIKEMARASKGHLVEVNEKAIEEGGRL